VGSTSEPGEPVHCNVPGGASEWYAIQAESDGMLTVDTVGSAFDTVLAVYTDPGDTGTLEGLVSVACNNDIVPGSDPQSAVTFPCARGVIYFVAVDGVGGATGMAVLNYFNARPRSRILPIPQLSRIRPPLLYRLSSATAKPYLRPRITVASTDPSLVPVGNIVKAGAARLEQC
jgi:hypothetical protein